MWFNIYASASFALRLPINGGRCRRALQLAQALVPGRWLIKGTLTPRPEAGDKPSRVWVLQLCREVQQQRRLLLIPNSPLASPFWSCVWRLMMLRTFLCVLSLGLFWKQGGETRRVFTPRSGCSYGFKGKKEPLFLIRSVGADRS